MAGQCKARFYVHHTAADVGGHPTPSGLGRSVVVNRKGTMKKRKLYEMVGRLTARVAEQEAEIVRLIADAAAETDVDEPPTDDDHHQLIHQVRTLLGFMLVSSCSTKDSPGCSRKRTLSSSQTSR